MTQCSKCLRFKNDMNYCSWINLCAPRYWCLSEDHWLWCIAGCYSMLLDFYLLWQSFYFISWLWLTGDWLQSFLVASRWLEVCTLLNLSASVLFWTLGNYKQWRHWGKQEQQKNNVVTIKHNEGMPRKSISEV